MQKQLSAKEKKILLDIARESIISHIRGRALPQREVKEPNLVAKRACFVSVKIDGMLRGCIGCFTADRPLYQLLQEMAISAATRDPRFYPMKEDDLGNFTLEISVLSELAKISSIDEIKVGVHGLYLEKNFSRGVLLPQVAVEYGWDRETFLSQTSLKAGLDKDDWREGADIYTFSALVFNG